MDKRSFLFSTFGQKKFLLDAVAILLFVILLSPIFSLFTEGIGVFSSGEINLGNDGIKQIKGTLLLVIFSSLAGGMIGTANAWLLTNCKFKGQKYLKFAQLLPLATPAYLLSAILIDIGSIYGIRIHGMIWGVLVMSMTTYPYVFLLSSESFAKCGQSQFEACRSLGVGPWSSFMRISLPLAIPSIGAGIALLAMEVINELGAVQLLNIPSISAGIIENWIIQGNPSGAISLAFIALLIVLILVAYEKRLRRNSRRWSEGINRREREKWELKGIRAILAQSLAIIPTLFTLGIPCLWVMTNLNQIKQGFDLDIIQLTIRSFILGILAASLTVFFAIFLSICKRWNKSKLMRSISFLSGIGYSIPGAVIALALLSFSSLKWSIPSLVLLLWGYSVRFLAVSKGGLDAGLERINPNIDEAATILGEEWPGILKKIHIPLLKGPIVVGALLIFVDTIKELPLTFVLRPFDFDTLSVRIFQYAGDERMAESIVPGLIVLVLGLLASIALMPSIDSKNI